MAVVKAEKGGHLFSLLYVDAQKLESILPMVMEVLHKQGGPIGLTQFRQFGLGLLSLRWNVLVIHIKMMNIRFNKNQYKII